MCPLLFYCWEWNCSVMRFIAPVIDFTLAELLFFFYYPRNNSERVNYYKPLQSQLRHVELIRIHRCMCKR